MIGRPPAILLIDTEPAANKAGGRVIDLCHQAHNLIVEHRLPNALTILRERPVDAVILGDGFAGDGVIETVRSLATKSTGIPILFLTDDPDSELAVRAIRRGAQDVLVRHQLTAQSLSRSILLATERQRINDELSQRVDEMHVTCSRYQDLLSDNQNAVATAEEMAKRADFVKTRLFAGMSHELRTPLNSILGYAEAMKIGLFGPLGSHQYSKYIDHIHTSGHHLLALIDKLMELSHTDAEGIELREEPVDLALLVRGAMGVLARTASEKLVSVEFAQEKARIGVRGDGARLLQALLSILSNAVKFTEPGGIVRIALSDLGPDGIVLTTTDTGIGIADGALSTIFEPFASQVDGRTHPHQGAGLGLSLAKNLIELHDGEILIESRLNVGTVVTISLPRHRILHESIQPEQRLSA